MNIVITGASSGIGAALARRYAQAGRVLGLFGRDAVRLDRVAEQCRASGSEVRRATIDVRDRVVLGTWLREFDRASPVDLVIANAGVYTGVSRAGALEDADAGYELMQANLLGALNTVQPLIAPMLARGSGQIVIMSSIAGFVPLPDAPAYSASKAALLSYGLALRAQLHGAGVRVTVVCPGYVTTPMSAQVKGWKPLEISAEDAAERICRKLRGAPAVITFPCSLALAARVTALLPDRLMRRAMDQFRVKGGRAP